MVSLIGLEKIFFYLRKNTIYYIIVKFHRKIVLKIYNPLVYEGREGGREGREGGREGREGKEGRKGKEEGEGGKESVSPLLHMPSLEIWEWGLGMYTILSLSLHCTHKSSEVYHTS